MDFIFLLAAPQAGGLLGGSSQMILVLVLMVVIFYFFMIRPQQKRQKELQRQREALAKGDKIITAGGIHGTIREVREKDFLVEIANGVNIRIDKGSVYVSAREAETDMANKKD
ncbi:preprotein translocase subunit YajC [Porphyromonas gingivalis]|uniref:preprotein translocase subunit YajC n=1 Tax=Porphyromonas gingivalis TaxID=837 RepID=UPI001F35AF3F|nr:preprotein translocase subunit YajC [Porphyromonas gingivalis]MCE8193066.1 preprotein translocase subunit YajC [Porphyromonas gingivalis]